MFRPRQGRMSPSSSGAPPTSFRPRTVLAVLSLAGFMANLDLFIVNVAFAKIAQDFRGSSVGDVSWVLNGYAIIFAALLVPFGRLADKIGRKRMFQLGLAVFTIASVACAAAPDLWTLVAFRLVQAAGAAALTPTSLGLLLAAVPAEKRLPYVRIWTAVAAVAAAAGPVLGGLLVAMDWRWVFLVNLPVGLIAIIAAHRWVPDSRDARVTRLPDLAGTALLTLGIASLALAIVKGGDWGWSSASTVGAFIVAAALLAVFLWRSEHHPVPLVEPDFYRVRTFAFANVAMVAFSIGMAAYLLVIVLWMQNVWHWSVTRTGFAMAPAPTLVPIVTILVQRLARRISAGLLAAIGCASFAAGTIITLSRVGADGAHYASALLPGHLLVGIGIGLALPTLLAAATHDLPPHRASTGSGVINMTRQLGFVLGVAIVVAIVGSPTGYLAAHTAFVHASSAIAIVQILAALASLGILSGPTTAAVPSPSAAGLDRG